MWPVLLAGLVMASLMMLRRSYAYTSVAFVAVWILLNVAYVNRLSSHPDAALPHAVHRVHGSRLKTHNILSDVREYSGQANSSPSGDELLDMQEGMERHSFNVTVSNATPLDRTVPDFRPHVCPKNYNTEGLPSASIIICFHNEALSTLLRTIHSIVRTTPRELLQEVILVDDASTYDYLGAKLSRELKDFPQVKLIRARERLGIARARNRGIRKAHGRVLVFLDSHCECAPGWLEPLLVAIEGNPRQIVCPEVDIIDYNTFQYTMPDQSYEGSFDWELNLVLRPLTARQKQLRQSAADPIRTPTMLGGIFAVDTSYFKNIGLFDMEMEIWGGENLELSFRVWICGGSIAILPCSRVGHVFRPVIPYGFPVFGAKATLHRNNQRVAESWMDSFKKFYYAAARKTRTFNPVMVRSYNRFLRTKLDCKDFYWYLTNIVPEAAVPPDDAEYFGQIKNKIKGCLKVRPDGQTFLVTCIPQEITQTFHLTPQGQLMHGKLCIRCLNPQSKLLKFGACDNQSLICAYHESSRLTCQDAVHDTALCLEASSLNTAVFLHSCHANVTAAQSWSFTHHLNLELLHLT